MRDLKGEIGDSVTNIETIKQKGEKPIPEKGLPPKKNNQIVIVLIVMIIILFIIFLFFLGSNGDNDYFSSDTYSPYISPFHTGNYQCLIL